MKTLGHSQITLTMNTYAHVHPEVEQAAIDAAARAIFSDRTAIGCTLGCTARKSLTNARSRD